MKLTRVGIDLAKNVFQAHGVDEYGQSNGSTYSSDIFLAI